MINPFSKELLPWLATVSHIIVASHFVTLSSSCCSWLLSACWARAAHPQRHRIHPGRRRPLHAPRDSPGRSPSFLPQHPRVSLILSPPDPMATSGFPSLVASRS